MSLFPKKVEYPFKAYVINMIWLLIDYVIKQIIMSTV